MCWYKNTWRGRELMDWSKNDCHICPPDLLMWSWAKAFCNTIDCYFAEVEKIIRDYMVDTRINWINSLTTHAPINTSNMCCVRDVHCPIKNYACGLGRIHLGEKNDIDSLHVLGFLFNWELSTLGAGTLCHCHIQDQVYQVLLQLEPSQVAQGHCWLLSLTRAIQEVALPH